MSESFRATPPEQHWSGSSHSTNGNGFQNSSMSRSANSLDTSGEVGRALLIGLLGGLVSAAGYLIYRRLPEDQKERLQQQVRTQVQQRISEIRANFNI